MATANDPLVPLSKLGDYVRGPSGGPISAMSLWRWRKKGVIRVVNIGGRNYCRLAETLKRIGFADADEGSGEGEAA